MTRHKTRIPSNVDLEIRFLFCHSWPRTVSSVCEMATGRVLLDAVLPFACLLILEGIIGVQYLFPSGVSPAPVHPWSALLLACLFGHQFNESRILFYHGSKTVVAVERTASGRAVVGAMDGVSIIRSGQSNGQRASEFNRRIAINHRNLTVSISCLCASCVVVCGAVVSGVKIFFADPCPR